MYSALQMSKTYHAVSIDPVHFYYLCPYETNICPALFHTHGSRKNTQGNRVESRSSHCSHDAHQRIFIVIDEDTKRKELCLKGDKITFKRYRKYK